MGPAREAGRERRDTSNLTLAFTIGHVRARLGDHGVEQLLALAGEDRPVAELCDERRWSTQEQKVALFVAAAELLDDPDVGRRIGESVLDQQTGTALRLILRTVGTPAALCRSVAKAAAKFSTNYTCEAIAVGRDHAVISNRLHEPHHPHQLDCDYTAGLLAQVPAIFGLPTATVTHDECQVRGAAACIYELRWRSRSRLPWRARRASETHLAEQLRLLSERHDALQSTVVDLVSPADVDTVLARIVRRAADAVRAQRFLLALTNENGEPSVHHDGMTHAEAMFLARDVLAAEPDDQGGSRIIVDVASARHAYGRLAAINAPGYTFFPEERQLLATYARQAAVALDAATALAEARHRGDHDALTGLPNSRLFGEALAASLADAARTGSTMAVLFCDLDRFKTVNDSLGHARGDQLLQDAAARLRGCVREDDVVARLGGDEFAVLLRGLTGETEVALIGDRIVDTMRRPFVVDGQEVFLTVSIGAAHHPADGTDADDLLRNADAAMYRAKAGGRDALQRYRPAMNEHARHVVALAADLRNALARDELEVHYQPQFDARRRIVAVEALVRWQHPELGWIPASEFVPMAEQSGLILALDEWVLGEACRRARTWQDIAGHPIRVAVNLSAHQLSRPTLPAVVAAALAAADLDPGLLELEWTETAAAGQPERVAPVLRDLVALGIHIAIDDYGTGYTITGHLKDFPVGRLKIDRSFVAGLPLDRYDRAIVSSTITLAHSLGMHVTAEGVETTEQAEYLLALGCDLLQGYLLARPQPAEELVTLLRSEPLEATPAPSSR